MRKPVMVVDDDIDILEWLKMYLELEDYPVRTADRGSRALKQLLETQERPGLILLDVMMPEMGGAEVLAELRRHEPLSGIPVVLMTAGRFSPDVVSGPMIRKPLDPTELMRHVQAHCGPSPGE
jgi:DNA-binding response OmpR family regulator